MMSLHLRRRRRTVGAAAETQAVIDDALEVRAELAAITARLGIHVERLQTAVDRFEELRRGDDKDRDGRRGEEP